MGWGEHRIQEYCHGRPAPGSERRAAEQAQSVRLMLAALAAVGLVHGLWMSHGPGIAAAAVIGMAGPIIGWLWRPHRAPQLSGVVVHGRSPSARANV